jgi:membrane protease subunit HflC
MMQKSVVIVVVLLALVIVAMSTVFFVDEREKAIVFKFGEIVRYSDGENLAAGMHFKTPIIEDVKFYDARVQTMDAEPELYLTAEKKNLVVDSYVKWRIKDVYKYFVTVGGDRIRATNRLREVVNNGLRDEFGRRTVNEVISSDRGKIMEIMSLTTDKQAEEYGIEVLDVRLQRVDLVADISQSVYRRMEAERARVAKERRAQGAEAAEAIRADADRQREIILAEAYRQSEQIRGEGDARATNLYADAFGQDAGFYSLYRSLNAYKDVFASERDLLVLEPDSEFFRYFNKSSP